jgi:hypothetical protein
MSPWTPAPDFVFTMTPPPRSIITGIACFARSANPRTFTWNMRSKSGTTISVTGGSLSTSCAAALLQRRSTPPKPALERLGHRRSARRSRQHGGKRPDDRGPEEQVSPSTLDRRCAAIVAALIKVCSSRPPARRERGPGDRALGGAHTTASSAAVESAKFLDQLRSWALNSALPSSLRTDRHE